MTLAVVVVLISELIPPVFMQELSLLAAVGLMVEVQNPVDMAVVRPVLLEQMDMVLVLAQELPLLAVMVEEPLALAVLA